MGDPKELIGITKSNNWKMS